MPSSRTKVASGDLSVSAVGDMMFDRRLTPPRMYYHHPAVATCIPGLTFVGIPFINGASSRTLLASDGLLVDGIDMTAHATESVVLDLSESAEDPYYPFVGVEAELRRSSIVFGNLECPLSTRGRRWRNDQCYSAPPHFAAALASIPFHVVSFANNHCLDFGELAFYDTLDALNAAGIAVVGAGRSIEEACREARFDVNGVRIAFLAYTMVGSDSVFACDGECGAAPLNPVLLETDVRRVRSDVDLLIVSAHWGAEMMARPWPWLARFAHHMVDAGVDVVFGHHSHVPSAIEIYNGRPICYSLGNFCFGHGHTFWGDNMIIRLLIRDARPVALEVTPITGCYQPRLMDDIRAAAFHQLLVQMSEPFGTVVESEHGRSHVTISEPC